MFDRTNLRQSKATRPEQANAFQSRPFQAQATPSPTPAVAPIQPRFGHSLSRIAITVEQAAQRQTEKAADPVEEPASLTSEPPIQAVAAASNVSSSPSSPPAAPPASPATPPDPRPRGHSLANISISPPAPVQRQPNETGLPNDLKTGVENLSGLSLDDVNVHRNSDKPAQVGALAYAQGSDIHVGPGQEAHLPHEAWHVAQQKQGRVQPTFQMKQNVNINNEAELEQEADVMGAKAATSTSHAALATPRTTPLPPEPNVSLYQHTVVVQRVEGLPGRLHTEAISPDKRKMIGYWGGWIADAIDLGSQGYFYDLLSLMYSVGGSTNATTLARAEELFRFAQNHPEIMNLLGLSVETLAGIFGLDVWIVRILVSLFSRGEASDLIGSIALAIVPQQVYDYAPPLFTGLARRGGRSLLNRFLGKFPGGSVSSISRVFHGYEVSSGSLTHGPPPVTPGNAFWFDPVRLLLPVERLHIIPARRNGPMTDMNAAYGASGSNSLMIPMEAANFPAVAIRTPTGTLEAMVMRNGLFLARGLRPLVSKAEKDITTKYHVA